MVLLFFSGTGVTQQQMSTLRRNNSTSGVPKPAPPMRRTPSIVEPPIGMGGSNNSTPRSSMEHLPPPPPHLLHSDEDEPPGRAKSPRQVAGRGITVAESVKALQQSGHLPRSPQSLRRAHSVAGAHSPFQQKPQVSQQTEQIYAPVAQLQQKIQQRQMMQQQQQQQQHILHQQQQVGQSPEGDKYGFGMQFYQHQNQFYHHQMQDGPAGMQGGPVDPSTGQQFGMAAHDQIMRDIDTKMRQRPQPPPMVGGGQSQPASHSTFAAAPPSQQQQQLPTQQTLDDQNQSSGSRSNVSSSYDAQTALRVRRWIESRTVSDVRDCRPVLNLEIQQGLALRKTHILNDRSAPRFSN